MKRKKQKKKNYKSNIEIKCFQVKKYTSLSEKTCKYIITQIVRVHMFKISLKYSVKTFVLLAIIKHFNKTV